MEIEKVKEIKKALEDHSIEKLKYQDGIKIKEIDFISILTLINELESENNELKNIIAKEQEACVECELEQSWELFARDKEIDRLRAESKRFENNMKSVLEIEKKNVVKEFAEKLKQAICDNTYPYFDKNGKPVNIWNTDGFDKIDELLKEHEK